MIDLVMGYARGYNGDQIRPFLKSLRQTGYQGRIVLIADGGAMREAANWGADARPCPVVPRGMLPHSARFVEMARLARALNWTGLFVADTRDIIFQKDITEALPSTGLNVFEEDGGMTIGSCPYNSLWIELGYGPEVLKAMNEWSISCVGTTCGARPEMLGYLDRLSAEVQRLQPRTRRPQDQAAHNWLIRFELKPTIYPNEVGEVYTVGYIPRGSVRIVNEQIVNVAGQVPAVIHQWDRHRNLKKLVQRTLR